MEPRRLGVVMDQLPRGAAGFDDAYWRTCYGQPQRMDGVVNAKAHAAYLKASFDVVMQPVRSVVDLGFGLGHVLREVLDAFRPAKALGIEPSAPAFESVRFADLAPAGVPLKLERLDLLSWCRRPNHPSNRFDLGVCTGVWQYLTDDELEQVVPALATRLRWLYLTVPTDVEFGWQARDEDFVDPYATHRSRGWYRELLSPVWVPVGARLLESRLALSEDDSPFTDHLFRGWEDVAGR